MTETKKKKPATTRAAKPKQGDEPAMQKSTQSDIVVTEATIADLIPDDKNLNKGTQFGQHLIEKSLRELGAGRSLLLDKNNRIIAGNKTTENAAAIDLNGVIIVESDGTKLVAVKRTDIDLDSERGRKLALADNATSAANLEWDEEQMAALQAELDNFEPGEWGVNLEESVEDMIARKEREFKERMEAGEITEEDEEYQEFLDKFKRKKTTDDCYTPDIVYDAVARWVMDEYGVDRKDFERPFFPGGDYTKHVYPEGCIVVDNPPFSILAEILQFYKQKGIKFFLFAPTLTLFSSSSSSCTALPTGASVIYENGASVNTSFLTNLEDPALRLRSVPSLYRVVTEAVEEYRKELTRELPKYTYPDNVVTSAFVARLSHYGIEFSVNVAESQSVSALDSQREQGKAIYGKGYLVSDWAAAEKAAAEKAAAEKAAAEKAAATRWSLSEREKQIISKLNISKTQSWLGEGQARDRR